MILLGVDLGERRIGFAMGDSESGFAVTSGHARIRKPEETLAAILEKVKETAAEIIILGHPLNMDGRSGPKAKEAVAFAETLRETGKEVVLWDERLTTYEAARLLKDAGVNRKQRKNLVDAGAAQRILSSYMAWRKRNPET